MNWKDSIMTNGFGTDILIQADDPAAAAQFYVKELGFAITEKTPDMISIHGKHIRGRRQASAFARIGRLMSIR